jgi:hypothetical protein
MSIERLNISRIRPREESSRGVGVGDGGIKQKKGRKGWTTSPTCGASRPLFEQQIRRSTFCLFPFLIEEFNNVCRAWQFQVHDSTVEIRYLSTVARVSRQRKFMIAEKEGASAV